jgi:hypothetical protein
MEFRRLSPEGDAASMTEARRLFDLQHAASRIGLAPTLAVRLDRLERLRRLVFDGQDAFSRAISDDFGGRSPAETKLLEIVPTLSAIRFARKQVGGWMKPQRRRIDPAFQPGRAWVRHEPLGIIGIISPWNYPLQLAVSPLVDAIAAGNRVMVKPSEQTPGFSSLLQRLVADRFDEAEIAIVTGGPEVGQYFSTLPFDHLLFTGSTCNRPQGLFGGRGEPDAGHARAGRKVARHPLSRFSGRQGGAQHCLRQAGQCRADLHCARLCARARGAGTRLCRGPARPRAPVLPDDRRQP